MITTPQISSPQRVEATVRYATTLPDGSTLLGVEVKSGERWKGNLLVPGWAGVYLSPGHTSYTAGHATLSRAVAAGLLQGRLNRDAALNFGPTAAAYASG